MVETKHLSPKVLIVDDEDLIRELISKAIARLRTDAEIHEAKDGYEAGCKITSIVPSFVILDLKLPGMDGFKVCQSIRSNKSLVNTRVLAISAFNSDETRRRALEAGANDFLGKPFDSGELQRKLSVLLAG